MNAVAKITTALEALFAEQDAKIIERDLAWVVNRMAALEAFKTSPEWKAMKIEQRYARMFAMVGGKTWFQLFKVHSTRALQEIMVKNHEATIAKRNAKIARKLIEAGVESVETAEVGYCKDGFNGFFKINGERMVKIESILAGGYNIQRLHQRVLVKVK